MDTERELFEIKILERKTRLLREYKQLAQESHCTDQSFIDSLFEDDTKFEIPSSSNEPPTKVRRLNVGDLTDIIEPYKQRIANKPAIQQPSSSTKPVATVPKPFTIPINKDTSKLIVIDKSKVVTPSTPTTKKPIPVPMASSRSNLHKQMMERIKQSTSHAAATAKRNLNNKIVAKPDLTKAGTVSSTTGRVAHASTNPAPQLALIDRFATKIPFNQRHRSLQKLHEEFCKHGEVDDAMAVEMAQREEKLLFDRSETPVGYASSLAGVVRTIRNKQFNIPSVSSLGQPRRQPSITETMEKERKQSGPIFTEDQLYQHLSDRYLMTSDQLKSNGYPFVYRDDEGKKRVKIEGVDEKKMFSNDNDFRRTCCRCGTEYQLRPDGTFISSQDCIFHWKRAFKKRINRTMETRYGCCDSDLTVKGCVVHPHHVCQTMRRQALTEFARTPPQSGPNDHRSRKVYAIDCEMVYTTWGISLARLTMVDWNDELVLDVLVKPKETIIDCNTKFSGLTIDVLENAECDLEKARRKLFEFVNSETILIGHSLESDLRSLRLVHRRIVDTAIVYPHRLGPPMKRALRNLASDYLQKIIQEDVEGHCSKEDASTCMQLMLKKMRGDIGSS
ncbi:RNA exonuclease 1-like protein [Aphelenchoides bicaudatus]|nr:RNA exonuclease 1-like protein [Aphelenchoides bicaudatus]